MVLDFIFKHHHKLINEFFADSIWHSRHRRIALESDEQGHNEGVPREAQFPGLRVTMGAPKSSNNVTSTFFNTVHLLPKGLRFEHGAAKLASCTGRHLTSLRPCKRRYWESHFTNCC